MLFKFLLQGVALCGFVLAVSGCGSVSKEPSQSVVATAVATPEQAVMARAQGRWDALLAKDLVKAYGFISPAGRTTLTLDLYTGRIDPQIWRKAVVQEASCAQELCTVKVKLDYVLGNIPLTHVLSEKWIFDSGSWWFVYTPQSG